MLDRGLFLTAFFAFAYRAADGRRSTPRGRSARMGVTAYAHDRRAVLRMGGADRAQTRGGDSVLAFREIRTAFVCVGESCDDPLCAYAAAAEDS